MRSSMSDLSLPEDEREMSRSEWIRGRYGILSPRTSKPKPRPARKPKERPKPQVKLETKPKPAPEPEPKKDDEPEQLSLW